jgi:hypothetical protein
MSSQTCDVDGRSYGPCDCPDAASSLGDAGKLPDGYAPLPPLVGNQGYNAIWAVNPAEVPPVLSIMLPLFSAPDCSVLPPYGQFYGVFFNPSSAGPSGTFPACPPSGGPTPCYEPQQYTRDDGISDWENVPGGKLVLSAFNGEGIATGTMNTAEGIVPLTVKKCP